MLQYRTLYYLGKVIPTPDDRALQMSVSRAPTAPHSIFLLPFSPSSYFVSTMQFVQKALVCALGKPTLLAQQVQDTQFLGKCTACAFNDITHACIHTHTHTHIIHTHTHTHTHYLHTHTLFTHTHTHTYTHTHTCTHTIILTSISDFSFTTTSGSAGGGPKFSSQPRVSGTQASNFSVAPS